jgi:hypothetical protein
MEWVRSGHGVYYKNEILSNPAITSAIPEYILLYGE